MRKLMLALVGLLALAGISPAHALEQGTVTLMKGYDVGSDSYTFGVFGDANSRVTATTGVFGPGTAAACPVETVGSSTTVTASTASTCAPFAGPGTTDLLLFNYLQVEYERVITAEASVDEVTVDAAIDLGTTGVTFRWKNFTAGTGAEDGWFYVQGLSALNFQYEVDTINATSLDFVLQCRASKFASADQIKTQNYTAVGNDHHSIDLRVTPYEQCRVGWKYNTDTGAQSVDVYLTWIR